MTASTPAIVDIVDNGDSLAPTRASLRIFFADDSNIFLQGPIASDLKGRVEAIRDQEDPGFGDGHKSAVETAVAAYENVPV